MTINRAAIILFSLVIAAGQPLLAQYEDYESYQTFSDLNKNQRDFGLVLAPSLMYTSIEEQNAVPSSSVTSYSRKIFFYDAKMGYIFRGGFYFGLLYAGESQQIDGSSPATTRESVGLGFGYVRWGFAAIAHFFPYSRQDLDGTDDVSEYTSGLGYQLELAYYFRLGKYVSIGPQLTYKSIRYGDSESVVGNVGADAESAHKLLTPMLTMIFNLYRG